MAELTNREKLQPALLDRLTDDEPSRKRESRERRIISMDRLRQCVLRDLGWLLNSGNLGSVEDLGPYPFVAESVLNYGVVEFSGVAASSVDLDRIQQMVQQAIWDFEPRIRRETVNVRVIVDEERMSHNALTFEIEGELWGQQTPMRLLLRTEIDLESGGVNVTEASGSG